MQLQQLAWATRIAIILAALNLSQLTPLVQAQDNPFDAFAPVSFIQGGLPYKGVRAIKAKWPNATNGYWNPDQKYTWQDWGKTTGKGNRIESGDMSGYSFPCDVIVIVQGQVQTFNGVTRGESDSYWDNFYVTAGPSWQKGGTYKRVGASFSEFRINCYAEACKKDYWLNPEGFKTLVKDEYEEIALWCEDSCPLQLTIDHCILCGNCCTKVGLDEKGNKVATKTLRWSLERNGTSPL